MTCASDISWALAQEHYRAWWAHEAFGRCAMSVHAPKKGHTPTEPPPRPATPEERWTDLDYYSALCHWQHDQNFLGGEAFDNWGYGYPGHTTLAVYMGCPITLDFETGWIDPILKGEDFQWPGLKLDTSHRYWKFHFDWLRRGAAESDPADRLLPGVGAFGGGGDTLAWLRGSDRLLYDVSDRPDQVRDAEMFLMEMWCEAYDKFYAVLKAAVGGSTCWFPLWAPGKFYVVANDFSYMISPKMFRDIFLPAIERQVNFLDYSIYHVDGEGAFAHVDALCELPRLQAIQILPGAGKPSALHYLPVLKKVQARGKNLFIYAEAGEVESILSELSARGLFLDVWCRTEDEARSLLKNAEKWSRDR